MSRFDGLMFYAVIPQLFNDSVDDVLTQKVFVTQEAVTRNLAQYTSAQPLIHIHVCSQ